LFIDFVLLWAVALNVTKAGLKGYMTTEAAAVVLLAAASVVAMAAVARSKVLRRRVSLPRFVLSLALFSLSAADGDIPTAIHAAILTSALPIAAFGLYIMIRSAFGRI
jgi:hypothetical protein